MLTLAILVAVPQLTSTTYAEPLDTIPELYDPEKDIISSGVTRWLYLGSLLYQAPLWSQGLVVGFGLDPWSNKAAATQLLVTPTTFFGFLWMTRHRKTTLGMLSLSYQGASQGMGIGWMVGDLLFEWGRVDDPWVENTIQPTVLTAVAGSVTGHILGFQHADAERLNWGNAEMLGHAGLWGAAYSGFIASLIMPWEDTYSSESGVPLRRKAVELATLAGWGSGLYLWHNKAPRDFTTGDAISTYNATGLSIWTAVAAYSLLPDEWSDNSNEWVFKSSLLVPALVNAGGLYYGYRFHRNRDVGFGQSLLVSLGSILGATGVGGATALFFTPEGQDPDFRLASTTAAAGGWLGFHLTHMLLDTDSRDKEHSDAGAANWRVHLMPANAAGLFLAARTEGSYRAPLVVVEF